MSAAWNKRIVRKIAAAAIFLLAALVQVFFKNFPWPLDIARTEKLRSPAAEFGSSELVLRDARVMPNQILLSYDGSPKESADLDFRNAQIDPMTAMLLGQSGAGPPPSAPGEWDYVTEDKPHSTSGEPCKTFIRVTFEDPTGPPDEIHLFQSGDPNLTHFPYIEMKADSAKLIVEARTARPDPQKPNGPGCWHTLQSGQWTTDVPDLPVKFTVMPKSTLRITFVYEAQTPSSWSASGMSFKLAELGPLLSRGVVVRPMQEDGGVVKGPAALRLDAYRHSNLKIQGLELDSNGLRAAISGKAWAKENGKTLGFDLWDAVQTNMEFGALLAAGNALLLAWLHKLFFGKPERSD
jgi:hypothetical protein